MAGPATITVGLVLLALCAHHIAAAGAVPIPSSCCMSFISKKIPESRVVSYQLSTRSICPMAGVIFTTKKGQKFCGDPKQRWVQKYMKHLAAKQHLALRENASTGTRAMSTTVPAQRHPATSIST